MKKQFIGISILILFALNLTVYAGVPMDTVQKNVNNVLKVLGDPKLKAAEIRL